MFFIIFILLAVLMLALWRIINLLRKSKGLEALPYLIIFLGFGTILVSIFVPGGFEGMAIGGIGLIVGIIGVIWLLIYTIVKKMNTKKR
ncbi:hypothetical protein [Neobacillus niacini]|uniref:hypothetical protein n=1 Tax=Neobacillus niacini TaxID=86668 RepID=UPI002857E496|nr:hypothetical protein [Neobacillus niacini]MDR7003014.1 hypothetical protein [Neobacillus niacini]